jgi:hypothetical protein
MSLLEDLEPPAEDSEETKALRAALRRAQRAVIEAKDRNRQLVEVTQEAAYDAMLALGGVKNVTPPAKDKRKGSEEVALWVMGDWQGSKVTPSYDTEVMFRRVMQFAEKAVTITDIQRSHHPVRQATIAFTGDMVEGLWNYPTASWEVDSTLFEQYVNVSRLLVDVVRIALANYEHVTVVPEWGNHGRIGSKRDNVVRNDNVDRMCYELARQLLQGEKRLTWQECPEDVQRLEIGNYRALVLHGDEVGRNGFASPGALVTHVAKWQSGSYPWQFRDAYIGHYHTHAEFALPNGLGSVYQTGSTESENRYAGVMLASSATPSQRLHFIDPDKGRVTAAYKVWLD